MALRIFDEAPQIPSGWLELRQMVLSGDIVLVREYLEPPLLKALVDELAAWRESGRSMSDSSNCHLELLSKGSEEKGSRLNYDPQRTAFDLYNYRIGNCRDVSLKTILPDFNELAERVLGDLPAVLSAKSIRHGQGLGRNLYIEFLQFSCGSGFIEAHTHDSIFRMGQEINPILLMTEPHKDFGHGGLWIENKGRFLDMSSHMNCGDLVLLRMDELHGVSPIAPPEKDSASARGRWTMTMFNY